MNTRSRTILIAGGGIAGLTAALCLSRSGFRVDVMERAEGFETIGAGLQISPNALSVLAMLGLDRAIKNLAVAPSAIRVLSGRTGGQITAIPLGASAIERFSMPYLVVHRADLQQILASACKDDPDISLHLDCTFHDVAAHANGVTALVGHRETNVEMHGMAMIGADGVHSQVRQLAMGGSAAVDTGFNAWRALIPSDVLGGSEDRENTRLWLHPRAHAVAYPVRNGRYLNLVAFIRNREGERDSGNGLAATERSSAEMAASFEGWHESFLDLLRHKARWTVWPLLRAPSGGPWAQGRVALIGDAAHAMFPFAAQGAAMGIEDAATLAGCLAAASEDQDSVSSALVAYESKRRARVRRVANISHVNGLIYHLPEPLAMFRDLFMKAAGGRRLLARQDWIYQWRPDSLPLIRQ
ncbi:MAG: FAD-dependent monooxygenase [Rhizobiaceae bacterium]